MRTEPSFSTDTDDHSPEDTNDITRIQIDSASQLLADYRQRYGLSVDPFVDDPHFPFYTGAQRREILDQLLHLCQFSHNLLVVTGEYGVGKTRMAQALIDALGDADDICFAEGQITSDINSLLSDVFSQFELATYEDFIEFCKSRTERDGLVVIIIDNAHHLTDEVIVQLIGLLQENLESRLHLVLLAEPYLLDRLENINAPEITLTDFFLEKLSLAESVDYLNFRMEMADYLGPEIFTEAKVEPWWRQSQGQLLLLHEHAQEKLLASVSAPRKNKSPKQSNLVPHIVATSVLIGGLFVVYLYFGGDSSSNKISSAQITQSVSVGPQSEPAATSSTISAQVSSISAMPSIASADVKNGEEIHSTTSVMPPTSTLPASEQSLSASQVVTQSVVPLAQTNQLHNESVQKQEKSSTSYRREIKNQPDSSELSKIGATIKNENTSAGIAKASSNFSDQEKAILAWDASEFTLQIVGLSSEKAAHEFIAAQSNKKDLLLFRSLRQGKDWFVVVSGHYPNSSAARQAAKSLPEPQLKAAPWPRDLKTIHREISSR